MHSFSHSRAVGAYSGLHALMGNVHGYSAHGNAEKGTAGPAGAQRGEGGAQDARDGEPLYGSTAPKAWQHQHLRSRGLWEGVGYLRSFLGT